MRSLRWAIGAVIITVAVPATVGAGTACDTRARIAPVDEQARIGPACQEPPRAETPRCLVATDARGDGVGDDAVGTDLTALLLGASPDWIGAEIQVAPAREAAAGRWEVSWEHPGEDAAPYVLHAEQAHDESRFGYRLSDDTTGPATGSIDGERGIVRIVAPRAPFGLPDGSRVANIVARTVAGPVVVDELPDGAAEHGSDLSFVAGRSCAARENPSCPVVVDRRGDAAVHDHGDSGALDILAVGASSDAETLILSVRSDGDGGTAIGGHGWTVSWTSGGLRWIAQAERGARGDVFRYGRALGRERPAGPRFGGRAATGSIDGVRVTIEVPLAAIGAPPDRSPIPALGAVSWMRAGEHTASAFHVTDRTRVRPYTTGVACDA